MTKEEKLQILESAMDLAYQKLAAMKAEDMGGEAVARLLDHMSNLGYLHERVLYPYKPLHTEDDSAPTFEEPEQSYPTPGSDEKDGDTETAAPVLDPVPEEPPQHPVTSEAEPTMTQPEARKILSDLSTRYNIAGKLPELFAKFGANKLSAVDPGNYAALVQAAKELVGEA